MAIYKSSFNKKPNKDEKKQEKQKSDKVKREKSIKQKTNVKLNGALISLIVFSLVFIVCIPPNFLKNVLLGLLGLLVYPVCIIGIFFSIARLQGKIKKINYRVKTKYIVYLSLALFVIWFIFHLILTSKIDTTSYGTYLVETYKAKTTAGGLLFSLFSFPIVKLLTTVGAYIFSAIALAVLVGLIVDYITVDRAIGHAEKKSKSKFKFDDIENFELPQENSHEVSAEDKAKRVARQKLGLEKGESTILSTSMPNYDFEAAQSKARPMSKREYILTPLEPVIPPENRDDLFLDNTTGYFNSKKLNRTIKSNLDEPSAQEKRDKEAEILTQSTQKETNLFSQNAEEIRPNASINLLSENKSSSADETKFADENEKDDVYSDIILEDAEDLEGYNIMDALSSANESENQAYKGYDFSGETQAKVDFSNASEISTYNSQQKMEQPSQNSSTFNQNSNNLNSNSFDALNSTANDNNLQSPYSNENDALNENSALQSSSYQNPYQENHEIAAQNGKNDDKLKMMEEEERESVENYADLQDLSAENNGLESGDLEIEETTADVGERDYVDEYAFSKQQDDFASTVETEVVRPSVDISKFKLPNTIKKSTELEPVKEEKPKQKQPIPPYIAPPTNLLEYIEKKEGITEEKLQDNIERLEQVLADFKVPAKVNNVQVGPAVTRYELTMPRGISVNKIAQMADDIAMTLASNGAIRVEAPIPGKNAVGIEVPNDTVSPVSLRELVESPEFKSRVNPLSFVLGRDINGDVIFCNLDKMPHLLVAGSTGSGKSVCLNTMLLSMCYKAGPQDLRLILVDPKMVEFTTYNGLPHLLIPEVITGKDMTINALDWAIKEMERRYALFAKNHVVNINEFNKSEQVRLKQEEKLPFIVIVVDELADLMLEAKREIEDKIAKLAAKARAAGIHLVLATQRPSVDVITGTVKANLPSRVAFALTNYMDSKTVLDGGGAEKLLGKGDMLFKPQDKPEPRRVQGAFVSNQEICRVVEYIKEKNKPVYDDDTEKSIKNPYKNNAPSRDDVGGKNEDFDPVLKDALRMFIQSKQASGSMISRRYSVGFNRAGRIMDQMYQAGFIGPPDGSKPRTVLITMEEYKEIFGDDE